jgi:polysaccharide export outer membrane protein
VRKILLLVILGLQIVFFTSCGVPKNFQHALYLQDSVTDAAKTVVNKPAIIEPGDRLNIDITATNKEAAEAFTISQSSGTTVTSGGVSGQAAQGYLVDSSGNIQLLQLSVMNVAGMTTSQVADSLERQLVNYIKGPIVTVSISNFKINVFGEVTKPGVLIVPDGKMNILEAIIQSGDLTLYGKRQNILVIREENGKREFGRVDITSNKIFESPYYNLKQNDVIYVESDKTKYIANDAIANRNIRNLGIIITLLTTVLLLQNIFK